MVKKDLIKEKIKKSAEKLFNEKGYNRVSLRDIAKDINISVGNLTYHYKKKEDLIEIVIYEQYKEFKVPNPVDNIKELKDFFKYTIKFKKERFTFFGEFNRKLHINESFFKLQEQILKDINLFLCESFSILSKKEILRKDLSKKEKENIVNSIIIILIYGISYFDNLDIENSSEKTVFSLMEIVKVCLSEKGLKEYKTIIF